MEIHFDNRAMIVRGYNKSVLLITDVHLGIHIDLEKKLGVSFPPQHEEILERIKRLVERYTIDTIVIIGDLKHTLGADNPYNWEVIPAFVTELQRLSDIIIIPGNHDGDLQALLPRKIRITDVRGTIVHEETPRISAFHGHAWPSKEALSAKIMVMGHNHPYISVVRKIKSHAKFEIRKNSRAIPVVIKSRLSKNCVRKYIGEKETPNDTEGILVVLPTFNKIAAGVKINFPDAKIQGPLFDRGCVNQSRAEIYSTDGVFLGRLEHLQHSNETVK